MRKEFDAAAFLEDIIMSQRALIEYPRLMECQEWVAKICMMDRASTLPGSEVYCLEDGTLYLFGDLPAFHVNCPYGEEGT